MYSHNMKEWNCDPFSSPYHTVRGLEATFINCACCFWLHCVFLIKVIAKMNSSSLVNSHMNHRTIRNHNKT